MSIKRLHVLSIIVLTCACSWYKNSALSAVIRSPKVVVVTFFIDRVYVFPTTHVSLCGRFGICEISVLEELGKMHLSDRGTPLE